MLALVWVLPRVTFRGHFAGKKSCCDLPTLSTIPTNFPRFGEASVASAASAMATFLFCRRGGRWWAGGRGGRCPSGAQVGPWWGRSGLVMARVLPALRAAQAVAIDSGQHCSFRNDGVPPKGCGYIPISFKCVIGGYTYTVRNIEIHF